VVSGVGDLQGPGTSPYATGGGGTVLEHQLGAVLLASLLTADPIAGLGDDVVPSELAFQASSFSPVDDLVVTGSSENGLVRRLSIGVRRAPSLVPSNDASVHLMRSFVKVIVENWAEVRDGRWRLQIATTSPNPDVQQLRALASIAISRPDDARFREAVAGSTANRAARDRLVQLDRLIAKAAEHAGFGGPGALPSDLTWRLLWALSTCELRLEGVDVSDRTACVARLRSAAREGTSAAADGLYSRLAELSGRYAPAGAVVDEVLLRRDLATQLRLAPSSRHGPARGILERLAQRLRARTHSRLSDGQHELELDRSEAREALVQAVLAVTPDRSLVVTREPDVGKSALAIKSAAELASDASITMLSLRDLPATTLEAEALLGVPLVELLAGGAAGPQRLLLLDGAEAVLEGRGELLTDLAAAAMMAGLGVIAVTRVDAGAAVLDALRQAQGGARSVAEHVVPRLSDAEVDQVASFAALGRLGVEPRARWLLGRVGLIDLLLRGEAAQALPDGALSEADVFAAVWSVLVRRREHTAIGGPSPDAREQALLSIARALLMGHGHATSDQAGALPSLRSDGLLLTAGPTSAWNPGDQFASDLIRDLCVARLLVVDGVGRLVDTGGPRWALRAARLACQALIAGAGANSERTRGELQAVFDVLAKDHGARWAALPLEAMLTLGSAREVIARAWAALTDDTRAGGLVPLVRVALQRHVQHGIGEPMVLAPLVDVALDHAAVRPGGHGRADEVGDLIRDLVLAWLRGLRMREDSSNSIRVRLREQLLDEKDTGDKFTVEALALLGPDLDDPAEQRLRALADAGGGSLGYAVDSWVAAKTMSRLRPDLLLALTDAYYIDRPRSRGPFSRSRADDGIRHHKGRTHIGAPNAGWLFGPFWWLLNAKPVEALRLVNDLLDHAASVRMSHLSKISTDASVPDARQSGRGLELQLPGGPRWCIGDEHVWRWYRGSLVGPYSAMSALLAVEAFADRLVGHGMDVRRVSELLLADAHNLAMPGLVVGFLVRHLTELDEELDPWLANPEVWHLEFTRVTFENYMHVRSCRARLADRSRPATPLAARRGDADGHLGDVASRHGSAGGVGQARR
jgi:hypothetical protein